MATNLFKNISPDRASAESTNVVVHKLGIAIEELQTIVAAGNADAATETTLQDVLTELQDVNTELNNITAQITITNAKYPLDYLSMKVTAVNGAGDPTEITFYSDNAFTTIVFRHVLAYDGSGNFESLSIQIP
jgi:hypothetical protein